MINLIRDDRKNGYSIISNAFLRDENLSLKAKGLLSLFFSLPPDWKFSVQGLRSITKEGRDSIYSTINELIDAGYCSKTEKRSESGSFLGIQYDIYEDKRDFKKSEPLPDLPYTEKADTVNPTQLNNNSINYLNNQLEKINKKELDVVLKTENTQLNTKTIPLPPAKNPPSLSHLSVLEESRGEVDESFAEVLTEWLDYKWKEKKQKYKTKKSFLILYKDLYDWSGGNVSKAREIINNSIRNNYSGIFKPQGGSSSSRDYLSVKKETGDEVWYK